MAGEISKKKELTADFAENADSLFTRKKTIINSKLVLSKVEWIVNSQLPGPQRAREVREIIKNQ